MKKTIKCHDCNKFLEVKDDKILKGKVLVYDNQGEKLEVVKCDDCYDKNKSLNNFQKCEVYSRIVGYIRPVEQWNAGKQQEYREREKYQS